uniref:Uncharacterized protein n=1 Tax=Panagrolaimus sp. JU765 TaxID=591449 RepID=A0AC34R283_9BILA
MLIVCGLVPPFSQVLSVILIGITIGLLGFNAGGFTKCAVLVARQYSPTVMAVMQVIMCLSLFAGSYLVPGLTPNGTHEEYAIVFYIYAAALIVANFVFCFLAQGEAAEWTRQSDAKTFTAKMPANVPTLQVPEKPDLHQVDV